MTKMTKEEILIKGLINSSVIDSIKLASTKSDILRKPDIVVILEILLELQMSTKPIIFNTFFTRMGRNIDDSIYLLNILSNLDTVSCELRQSGRDIFDESDSANSMSLTHRYYWLTLREPIFIEKYSNILTINLAPCVVVKPSASSAFVHDLKPIHLVPSLDWYESEGFELAFKLGLISESEFDERLANLFDSAYEYLPELDLKERSMLKSVLQPRRIDTATVHLTIANLENSGGDVELIEFYKSLLLINRDIYTQVSFDRIGRQYDNSDYRLSYFGDFRAKRIAPPVYAKQVRHIWIGTPLSI